jgi:SAM-dependent methyltransferase
MRKFEMSMSTPPLHAAAVAGFSSDFYDRGRPEYPLESATVLLEKVNIRAKEGVVLELGAGTGKFTRQLEVALRGTQVKIMASEPLGSMREKLVRMTEQGIVVLRCPAESIPLPDQAVDLVVTAQAFHWFANNKALQEIHRVLKPEGSLALIWNIRDIRVDWVANLEKIIDRYYEEDVPRAQTMKWKDVIDEFHGFGDVQLTSLSNSQSGSIEMIVDRVLSISVIALRSEEEKKLIAEEVRKLVENHPDTKGLTAYTLPYCINVYLYKKQ